MRGRRTWLAAAAAAAALAVGVVAVVLVVTREEAPPPPTPPVETEPPPPETQPPETEPPPEPEPTPPPPAAVPFAWTGAGAFVWNETSLDPGLLGRWLREAGFGWVVIRAHDGLEDDPIEADWVYRFRVASGLPVGAWGVLRTEPEQEAALASSIVERYGLDFYVANAELEYAFSGADGPSDERSGRSKRFVDAFRALRPAPFPVGLSSYCRADRQDIDWGSWRGAGFVFLPQAYVNELGDEVAPSACVEGARGFFPPASVHPTIGVYPGAAGEVELATYVELLDAADTVGFSVYLAETEMTEQDWLALGAAIAERGLATPIP
jgi:hypothetical protein